MLLLDAIWWWVLVRLTNRRSGRVIIILFMAAQMLGLVGIITARLLNAGWDRFLPKFAVSAIFIWHFLGLGLFSLLAIALIPVLVAGKFIARFRHKPPPPSDASAQWSRREFLRFAAAITPPILTLSASGIALAQLNHFRIRRFILPMADLPPDLDGMTIAQVSDMHIGRFTSGRGLHEMVGAVNELRADLVLLTGDLINDSLVDLTEGLDLVRQMESRFGSYLIEGNHDLIENPAEFERRARASGIPFLLDESAIVNVRGFPVQLLGLSWTRVRGHGRDIAITAAVRELIKQRQVDVFPILLAHHPHAFDGAVEAGLPLTLSGHTHGGQLMLNEQLGFGPAMFRYWSGLYQRGPSQLIVSNGVGNWFPIRTNAAAEIVHITLRRA